MKILYYFRELKTPMYWWQRIHWIDELERNGHVVHTINPLDYDSVDEACNRLICHLQSHSDYNLFLTCVDQDWIKKETIDEIRRMGFPTCLICWDNLELPYKHREIAPAFDIVWLTSNETYNLFEQWGCRKILFMPYAGNPYMFKPISSGKIIDRVGFIGTPYGSRTNILNELIEAEIPCSVYSDSLFSSGYNSSLGKKKDVMIQDLFVKFSRYLRFPIGRQVLLSTIINRFKPQQSLNTHSPYIQTERSVSDEMMQKLYSEFAISLNISELRDTYVLKRPIPKIHLRAFEIPMCGGLQLTSFNSEIAEYFEEGKEIVLYRSKDEMIDKARFYLNEKNEALIKQIKYSARLRAEHDHTWMRRFGKLFNEIGL